MRKEERICLNTEEMLAEFQRFDKRREETVGKIVIGSADMRAIYPSLDVTLAIDKVGEVFNTSEIERRGIDEEVLGLYPAMNSKEEKLEIEQDCCRFVHGGRKGKVDLPPSLVACHRGREVHNVCTMGTSRREAR